MRSSFAAFLRGFTLPFGVTAGQRIVFDGDNGRILVYDNANNLIGFFGPSAGEMVFFIQDDSGSYVNINAGPGAATIELNPADFPTHTIVEGRIQADIDETPEDPFLVLSSPGIDGLAALRLFLIGVGGTGNRARAVIDAADDSDADLVVNDRPIGLGGRRQQVLTGSDSSHSAAGFTITDMSLIDVAGIDDHTYEIHLHSRVELIGAAVSIWNVVLYVDGSEYERFDTIENTAAVTLSALIDAKVYWTAADNSTHDFEVYVEEVVNGQAIQLIGSATARRTLTMTDVGFMEQEP